MLRNLDLSGMINNQQKFIENPSKKTMPLRDLLSSKNEWRWGQAQEESDRERTIICADASSYGLRTVLLQVQDDGTKKPIAYALRSMTSNKQRCAQKEKEALATTWACETFADFVLAKGFIIETDYKPLVPLQGS